jgi:hypothetical protein
MMIASDRFDTIKVKEVDGRWAVCDAGDVTLYEYTTETAATYKAEQVREWGRKESRPVTDKKYGNSDEAGRMDERNTQLGSVFTACSLRCMTSASS